MFGIGIIIATMILGAIGTIAINKSYSKWGGTPSSIGITGEQMARMMLQSYGVHDAKINIIEGTLTDNFSPKDMTLNLSREVALGTSVASHAVACHETGHYLQHLQGYAPLKIRSFLVPITSFSSSICWLLLLVGIMFQAVGFMWIAIILYCISLLFSIITLPVEFNASRRAVAFLDGQNGVLAGVQVPAWEMKGTREMLRSAALTYVMSTFASVLNLVYLLLIARE